MRDFVLRLCLFAYPSVSRERDGRAIIDLARSLSSQSRLSFLREAGGILAGGIQARGKMLRLDVTGAPWNAARERLTLPLAVALLCLMVAFAFPSRIAWIGWWAFLAFLAAAVAVFGAASGRRFLTVTASFLVLALMVFDAFRELSTHYARWIGDVAIGEVNILAMWLPVALLLLICAGAVGRTGTARGPHATWTICAPIGISVILAVVLRERWQSASGSPLGGVFIYAPLVLAIATTLQGIIQKDPVTKTAGALLVAASCLPVMWLLAMVVPEPPVPDQYIPFVYYLPGVFVACLVMWCLLRRRVQTPGVDPRPPQLAP